MNNSSLTMNRIIGGIPNQLKRQVRSPFHASGRRRFRRSSAGGPIIHCTHHKMGTKWFTSVLYAIADYYGLSFQWIDNDVEELNPDKDIIVLNHSDTIAQDMSPCTGSHLIRDLRDVVVSGYHYHLWTKEAWAHVPSDQYAGLGFQEYLSQLSEEEGLLAEIERFARYAEERDMRRWDYDHPRFAELKYEDVFGNEADAFVSLFDHYGFTPEAIETCLEIASRFSFDKQAKKDKERQTSHLRSGRAGQWKDTFADVHKVRFKDALGDLLIQAGYESSNDW